MVGFLDFNVCINGDDMTGTHAPFLPSWSFGRSKGVVWLNGGHLRCLPLLPASGAVSPLRLTVPQASQPVPASESNRGVLTHSQPTNQRHPPSFYSILHPCLKEFSVHPHRCRQELRRTCGIPFIPHRSRPVPASWILFFIPYASFFRKIPVTCPVFSIPGRL